MGTNSPGPPVQLKRIRDVLVVVAYRKWDFREMGVSRAFPMSWALKRDTYAKLPDGVEKGNIARKLLKPLYGSSTACEDWYEPIRDLLAKECVGEVASLGQSVFCWTQHGGWARDMGGNSVIRIHQTLIMAF